MRKLDLNLKNVVIVIRNVSSMIFTANCCKSFLGSKRLYLQLHKLKFAKPLQSFLFFLIPAKPRWKQLDLHVHMFTNCILINVHVQPVGSWMQSWWLATFDICGAVRCILCNNSFSSWILRVILLTVVHIVLLMLV